MVGGGVRFGVARPQLRGEELAGVVAEREKRVVAEGMLERRRGLLLLGVADQDVRIKVDHQRLDPSRAGDPRPRKSPAGGLDALRPDDFPGPCTRHRGEPALVEGGQQPPTRGVRGDRPEQRGLVGQYGDVADRLGAVGDCDREINQYPPEVMTRPRPAHTLQGGAQLPGQPRRIGQVGQQPRPACDTTPTPSAVTMTRGRVLVGCTSKVPLGPDQTGPRQTNFLLINGHFRLPGAPTRRPAHEEPELGSETVIDRGEGLRRG